MDHSLPNNTAEQRGTGAAEASLGGGRRRRAVAAQRSSVCRLALRLWPAVPCAQGHGLRCGLSSFV